MKVTRHTSSMQGSVRAGHQQPACLSPAPPQPSQHLPHTAPPNPPWPPVIAEPAPKSGRSQTGAHPGRHQPLAASIADGIVNRQRATSTQDAEQAADEELLAASDGDTIEMRGASVLLRALHQNSSRAGAPHGRADFGVPVYGLLSLVTNKLS